MPHLIDAATRARLCILNDMLLCIARELSVCGLRRVSIAVIDSVLPASKSLPIAESYGTLCSSLPQTLHISIIRLY